MTKAFLLVDAQNDFTEGGALGVPGATAAFTATADFLAHRAADYAALVATMDWHIDPGGHWSDTPDFVHSWPKHCEAGTHGAALNPIIVAALDRVPAEPVRVIKGEFDPGYSGFDGHDEITGKSLGDVLRLRGISEVDVAGVATDYCVRATVLSAREAGLTVRVLTDLIAAVTPETGAGALREFAEAGATLVGSDEVEPVDEHGEPRTNDGA